MKQKVCIYLSASQCFKHRIKRSLIISVFPNVLNFETKLPYFFTVHSVINIKTKVLYFFLFPNPLVIKLNVLWCYNVCPSCKRWNKSPTILSAFLDDLKA